MWNFYLPEEVIDFSPPPRLHGANLNFKCALARFNVAEAGEGRRTFQAAKFMLQSELYNQNKRFSRVQSFSALSAWTFFAVIISRFFSLFWLKCKFHAEGYVNNKYISPEERSTWTVKASHHPSDSLDLIRFIPLHITPSSISTADLNGLVKFFISTDEINLPHRTWVRFAWCFFAIKERTAVRMRVKGNLFSAVCNCVGE